MQIQGQRAVQLNTRKWTFSFGDPPKTLVRTIGPQMYMITTDTEVATFWLDGGINQTYTGYEVRYATSNLMPPPGGISTIKKIAPATPTTVYTDVFEVTTFQGVILIFRFSPTQVLPTKVEVDPGSEEFSATIFLMTPQHGSDQNLRSENGHYSEAVDEYRSLLTTDQINTGIPITLKRLVGEQTWFVGVVNGGVVKEGGIMALKYGDSGNYIGMVVPTGNAVITFTEGLNVVELPPPPGSSRGIEHSTTFRLTTTNYVFDIWFDPAAINSYPPTIRSVGPIVAEGDSLIVKIQKVMFRA